jgi:hypothetical protein
MMNSTFATVFNIRVLLCTVSLSQITVKSENLDPHLIGVGA